MVATDSMPDESTLGHDDASPREGSRAPIRTGSRVGRYLVLDRLGAGGMGVVYAAYDPELDRRVAVKLLHPAASVEHGRQRLLREAQALARLQHPHVVAVHDVGVHDDAIFVAMELIEGRSVRAWLDENGGRRPWREVVDVFGQAAAGLAAAHEVALVHRDFKPDNVMIDRKGRVCVMDFGLARALAPSVAPPELRDAVVLEPGEAAERDASARALERVRERLRRSGRIAASPEPDTDADADVDIDAPTLARTPASTPALAQPLTIRGALLGTPAYMAPEQVRGEEADARSDQFSFCVALFEALHGRRPIRGRTLPELVAAIADVRIEPATDRDVPARLDRLVMRGLAGDPAARHPSMAAVAAALRSAPRSRRSIALAVVGSAVLVGAIAIASMKPAVCTSAAASLGAAWDAERRRAAIDGIASTGVPWSERASERTAAALDDYAARWIAQHEDACRATHERGDQSPELLDRRMACLDDRRRALDALTGLMIDADAALAERIVEATSRLADPNDCADREAMLARAALPADPEARAAIDDARGEIARASAFEAAGRYDDGLADADRALATASTLDEGALRAEAALARGRLLEGAGRAGEAADALKDAAHAGRVAAHDRVAAEAEVELVFVAGYLQSRTDEGRLWAEHARAAVERVRDAGPLAARLDNHLGVVLHRAGDVDGALAHLERALAMRRDTLGEEHLDTAESHHNVGVALRARERFADARAHHEAALAIRRAALGDEHPKVAESLVALAAVAMAERDEAAAVGGWRAALAIQRAAWGDAHPKVAATLVNLGNAAAEAKRYDDAEANLREAIAILERLPDRDDVQLARARYNLANVHTARGQHEAARDGYRDAVRGYERALGEQPRELVAPLVELARAHLALGELDLALATSRRAVAIAEAVDPRASPRAREVLAAVEAALAARP